MPRGLLFLLNPLVCLAAFAGTCRAIHAIAPFPDVPQVRAKFEYFRAHKNEFDTLFVGSSRIQHGLAPRLFDELMHAGGDGSRSFNFAIDGMVPPESFFFVRKILRENPRALKRVFIELAALRVAMDSEARGLVRDAYWHDVASLRITTAKAWQNINANKKKRLEDLPRNLADGWWNARLFLVNQTNLGAARDFMRVLAPAAKPGVATELGPQTDGFLPIDHAANAEKYRSDFEDFQRKKPGGRNVDHPNRNAFAQLAHDIRASGATPFFVVTPTTTRDFQARKDAPEGEALFAFDDPVEFPILYELDCRLDSDHLNAKGATELTRALAERFAHSCAKTH